MSWPLFPIPWHDEYVLQTPPRYEEPGDDDQDDDDDDLDATPLEPSDPE